MLYLILKQDLGTGKVMPPVTQILLAYYEEAPTDMADIYYRLDSDDGDDGCSMVNLMYACSDSLRSRLETIQSLKNGELFPSELTFLVLDKYLGLTLTTETVAFISNYLREKSRGEKSYSLDLGEFLTGLTPSELWSLDATYINKAQKWSEYRMYFAESKQPKLRDNGKALLFKLILPLVFILLQLGVLFYYVF